MILCANPKAQYLAHKEDIDRAILETLNAGTYIKGSEVQTFEREFAAYCGTQHAVSVASGTDAVRLALSSCGVGTGDEVITVSHTAVATVAAIEQTGAQPILVDTDRDTFLIDPQEVERAIGPNTKAVVAVHLFGQAADLTALKKLCDRHGLWLIEDCAQAHGAKHHGQRVGSICDIAAFSFYPTKNLGAIGDGGILVTDDPELASRARLLREYGWSKRYISEISGTNSRLDELQAAVLRVKLPHLDRDNEARRHLAALYHSGLSSLPLELPKVAPGNEHVYHLYVIKTTRRDALQSFLAERDIHAGIHYPVPIHRQPAYEQKITTGGSMKNTEAVASEILSLPMYPELKDEEVQTVVRAVKDFFAKV